LIVTSIVVLISYRISVFRHHLIRSLAQGGGGEASLARINLVGIAVCGLVGI
jgi:hypothetical protein